MTQRQLPTDALESDQACIPNISRRERRNRLASGIVMALVSVAVLVALLAAGVGRWWRLVLTPLFWGAAVGLFQWQDET
jgi:fatty acid desaturase